MADNVTPNVPAVPTTTSVPDSLAGQGAAANRMNAADLFDMVNNANADQDGNLSYDPSDQFGNDPFALNAVEPEEEGGSSPAIQPSNPIAQPVVPQAPTQAADPSPSVSQTTTNQPNPNTVQPTQTNQPTQAEIQAQQIAAEKQFTEQLEQLYNVEDNPEDPLPPSFRETLKKQSVKAHKAIFQHVLAVAQQQLQPYIEQTVQQLNTKQNTMKEFYETFPQLNKPEYAQIILNAGRAVNSNASNMTDAQRILAIGTAAALTLQLDPTPANRQQPSQPQTLNVAPSAPSQPVQQNVTPIRGMGGGSNTSTPATQNTKKNEIDELYDILAPVLRGRK